MERARYTFCRPRAVAYFSPDASSVMRSFLSPARGRVCFWGWRRAGKPLRESTDAVRSSCPKLADYNCAEFAVKRGVLFGRENADRSGRLPETPHDVEDMGNTGERDEGQHR